MMYYRSWQRATSGLTVHFQRRPGTEHAGGSITFVECDIT
jgi:hypothetical protein